MTMGQRGANDRGTCICVCVCQHKYDVYETVLHNTIDQPSRRQMKAFFSSSSTSSSTLRLLVTRRTQTTENDFIVWCLHTHLCFGSDADDGGNGNKRQRKMRFLCVFFLSGSPFANCACLMPKFDIQSDNGAISIWALIQLWFSRHANEYDDFHGVVRCCPHNFHYFDVTMRFQCSCHVD